MRVCVRVCVVCGGGDGGGGNFRRGSFSFPREVVRTEEVRRSDPLLSQQHPIFLCDGRCFLWGFFSTSRVLFQRQPLRPICKVAKWIRQKIRVEGELKTSTSPEFAAPIPRATDQQDGRHEFLHKHGRAHGGLQPAPLGAKKQVHVVVITPCPKLNQGPNRESRNFMRLRYPRNGQTRRCKTSSRVYNSRFRLKTTPSPPTGRAEMKLQSKADRAKVPMFM